MNFSLILLAGVLVSQAEFADKTQLAVIFTAAKVGRPMAVVFMSSIALIMATFVGVIAGGLVSFVIPTDLITTIAAIGFIIMGIYGLYEKGESEDEESESNKTLLGIVSLVFLAEMGDKTQLAVILLSAQSGGYLEVFIGASLGLTFVTIIGVIIGQKLRHFPLEKIKIAGSILFIIIGVAMLFEALGFFLFL